MFEGLDADIVAPPSEEEKKEGAVNLDYDLVVTAPRVGARPRVPLRGMAGMSYTSAGGVSRPAGMPGYTGGYSLDPDLFPPGFNPVSQEDIELVRSQIEEFDPDLMGFAEETRKGTVGRAAENIHDALREADYDPQKAALDALKKRMEGTYLGNTFDKAEDFYDFVTNLPREIQDALVDRAPGLGSVIGGIAGIARLVRNPVGTIVGALRRDFGRDNPNPGSVIVEDLSDPPQYGPPAPPAYEIRGQYGIPIFESMPIGMNTGGEVSYYMSPPAPPVPPALGGFDPYRGY